jgi:DNA adenine methylase
MKLKPIVKVNETKNYLTSWIIEKFPENYRELKYIELFLGGSSVLLNKDPSIEEVGNESNIDVLRIWQSIRDEPKLFISKLK